MAKKLKALVDVFHSAEEKIYPAGRIVDVSHLSEEQQAGLIAQGVFAAEGEQVILVSELESIEGVGTETAKALAGAGITSYQALVDADAVDLEARLGLTTANEIRKWQRAAKRAQGAK